MRARLLSAAAAAALAAAPLAAQTPVRVGEAVAGSLVPGDARTEHGPHYDAYVIRGTPGERVVVRMTSDDFITYLYGGHQRGGEWVEEDANSGPADTGSRLAVHLGADGAYLVRAAAFFSGDGGAYQLRVTPADPAAAVPVHPGQTVQGALAAGDHEGESGGLEDHYVIRGTPGGLATVMAESREFDAYLELRGWEDGRMEMLDSDDDSGVRTDAVMLLRFDDDAEYRIVVGSFDGTGTGRYTLRIVEGHVEGCDGTTPFQEKDDEAPAAGCPSP